MLVYVIILCLLLPESHQSCLRIDQDGEGIVNEPTDLHCVLQGEAVGLTAAIVNWYLRSPPGDEAIRKELAYVSIDNGVVDVSVQTDYVDKVSASWSADVFTLTIKKISLSDDGTHKDWGCSVVGSSCTTIRIEHSITVKVPPTKGSIQLSGLDNDWVHHDQPHTLTCTVDPIKPDASVYWSIDGHTQQDTRTDTKYNGDGTFRIIGTLVGYHFSKTYNQVDLSCLVTEKGQPSKVTFTQHYRNVDVIWPPTTRVVNTTAYPPIEGRKYQLTCDIKTDGDPITPLDFRWEGETSTQQTLVIDSLDRSQHTKTFRCAASNSAGEGDFGQGLALQVWYAPTVSASAPDPVVAGSSVTLDCSMTDGFPQQILQVQWKKDGNILDRDNTEGGDVSSPSITMRNIQKSDAGRYTCVLTNGAGEGQSQSLTLDVLYQPEGQSSLSISTAGQRTNIAVGEDVTFTCTHGGDSNPPPQRFTFYRDGGEQTNSTDRTWTPQTPSSINDGGSVSCAASNVVGVAQKSDVKVVTVEAYATIENFPVDTQQSPVYDDPDFFLDCLGAGNKRTVEWTKDGDPLPRGDFEENGSGTVVGSYSFDQTTAYRRRYQWIAPGTEATCDTVYRHDGEYTCTVTAMAGGRPTQESGTLNVNVLYPPINRVGTYTEVRSGQREQVTLSCDVCANPEPTQYAWSKDDGTVVNTADSSLTITEVTEEDFGNYTCNVTNDISTSTFIINLAASSAPEQPTEFRVLAKTSRSLELTWRPGYNGGLAQTFELDARKAGKGEYVSIQKGIADPNTHPNDDNAVSPLTVDQIGEDTLEPDTRYEFRVRGENDHPDRYGPYAYAEGETLKRPVVRIVDESLKFNYDTSHLFFAWIVLAGNPDRLQLEYREIETKMRRSPEWIILVSVDPDDGFYDDVTGAQLDPGRSYEFQLSAYEGIYVSLPDEDDVRVILNPPSPSPSQPTGSALPAGAIAGISLCMLLIVAGAGVAATILYMKRRHAAKKGHQSAADDDRMYVNVNPPQQQPQVPMQDQTYYNLDQVDKSGPYEELSPRVTSPPPLYDSVTIYDNNPR